MFLWQFCAYPLIMEIVHLSGGGLRDSFMQFIMEKIQRNCDSSISAVLLQKGARCNQHFLSFQQCFRPFFREKTFLNLICSVVSGCQHFHFLPQCFPKTSPWRLLKVGVCMVTSIYSSKT